MNDLRVRFRNWLWCRRHPDTCRRLTALFADLPPGPKSDEVLETEAAIWEDHGDPQLAKILRDAKGTQ